MSVVVTSRVKRSGLRGWMRYVCGPENERAAAYISDLGGPAETVAAVEGFLAGTARKNAALSLVQAFRTSELDPADPDAVRVAVETAYELMRRINPDSPAVAVAHVDSAGGYVHVHGMIVNHDLESGYAADSSRWQHWTVRRVNDTLMTERGLEVVKAAEVAAEPAWGKPVDESAALTVSDATDRATVRAYLRQEIDAAIMTEGVESLADVVRVAADRGIEIRITDGDRAPHLDAAAVDEFGAVIRNETVSKSGKPRRIKVVQTGSKLGSAYTPAGIESQIEAVRAYRAQEAQHEQETPHASLGQAQEGRAAAAEIADDGPAISVGRSRRGAEESDEEIDNSPAEVGLGFGLARDPSRDPVAAAARRAEIAAHLRHVQGPQRGAGLSTAVDRIAERYGVRGGDAEAGTKPDSDGISKGPGEA